MKTKNLIRLFLLLFAIVFVSCEKEDRNDGWYDYIPDGDAFARANTLRFYYIDEKGESLICPDDVHTFPITLGRELEDPLELAKDYNKESGMYNGSHNSIHYDEDEGLYYCMMIAYGDERKSTYSYPVYINGEVDKIDITYKYTDKEVIGAKYWNKIISWKYNGTHIYSDDDGAYKKVFITKAKGRTIISFKH